MEYVIEACALALFMMSAATFAVVLEHPDSFVRHAIESDVLRRLLMGLAMGGTATGIVYSPAGARSGAQMNPAVTLTFARLGKVAPHDAVAYIAAHFTGGLAGLALASIALSPWIADSRVNYVHTMPGPWGAGLAFGAEVVIAFVLMLVVLIVSNGRHARWTGLVSGALVALYILVEAPVSGMSMNPARSLAPAILTGSFQHLWIYFAAPVIGMSMAGDLFVRVRGRRAVRCAKLNHAGSAACIFRCAY